jgi:hypothetical protein
MPSGADEPRGRCFSNGYRRFNIETIDHLKTLDSSMTQRSKRFQVNQGELLSGECFF